MKSNERSIIIILFALLTIPSFLWGGYKIYVATKSHPELSYFEILTSISK